MVGRLLHAADFQRVLSIKPCARSPHFSAHHLMTVPAQAGRGGKEGGDGKLSTGHSPSCPPLVDESRSNGPDGGPCTLVKAMVAGHWLGMVVPKKLARRAVTRNLMKRQMRSLTDVWSDRLSPGLWVLRLKAGFDRAHFPSASSDALRMALRMELNELLARAARGRVAVRLAAAPPAAGLAPGFPASGPSQAAVRDGPLTLGSIPCVDSRQPIRER